VRIDTGLVQVLLGINKTTHSH